MNPLRRFSSRTVETIRRQRSNGDTLKVLAERHGVSRWTIRQIVQGRVYRDVGGPIEEPRWTWHRLSDNDVCAIREAHARGALLVSLAHQYGVTGGAIWQIVNGVTHAAPKAVTP